MLSSFIKDIKRVNPNIIIKKDYTILFFILVIAILAIMAISIPIIVRLIYLIS